MTDILQIQQNMCAIFTAEDSKEPRVRRLTGRWGGGGVIGWCELCNIHALGLVTESFSSEDKKHVCHLNPPHMVLFF